MSAIAPALFSGFVIARLRPELAAWLRAQYMADANFGVPAFRHLTDVWRTQPPAVAVSPTAVQGQAEQLHNALATVPSPSAVAPALIRSTIAREDHIPLGAYQPVRSLIAYFRFDVRGLGPGAANAFVTQLQSLNALFDYVRREPGLSPPARVQWEDDVEPGGGIDASWQYHTEPETVLGGRTVKGINCNSPQVWESEYDGSGVGFVDIELGWQLDHPDLPAPLKNGGAARTPFYNDSDPMTEYHGTSALGIVVGADNTQGIVGIAPRADFVGVASYAKVSPPTDPADITNAVLESLNRMQVGDVLLLEIQTTGGGAFPGASTNLPVEVVDLWFDAIRLAVGSGMVVIEPAGNGHDVNGSVKGWDLDTVFSVGSGRSLNRDTWTSQTTHDLDSGAIVVSACYSDLRLNGKLDRVQQCNYGSRVDCYAWGEDVYTTLNGSTYGVFGETSAASAIIAGAAILVQQMWRKRLGTSASSADIRALLSTYGTEVVGEKGVQPDLGLVASNLGGSPDVFVRDRPSDDGAVPGAFTSQSPDIIVRNAPVANPAAVFGEGSGTENTMPASDDIVADATNYVYVRMRNRNAADATNVVARVYWAEAGTLIVPTDWNFIGESAPITVPAAPVGQTYGPLSVTDPPIEWTPASGAVPPQMPAAHGCFIALLSCAADPAPPAIVANAGPGGAPTSWNDFLNFIGNNNNAAWRNFNVLDVSAAGEGEFRTAAAEFSINGPPRGVRFDFQVLRQLPKGARVQLRLDERLAALFGGARERADRHEKERAVSLTMDHNDRFAVTGVRLEARARYRCSIRIVLHGGIEPQPVLWALRQMYRGKEVGRVTFAVDKGSWQRALRR